MLNPSWKILHYEADATKKNANRLEVYNRPEVKKYLAYMRAMGFSPDEFPYASTKEGGKNAIVSWVPVGEQTKQGLDLAKVIGSGKNRAADNDEIVVMPYDPKEPEPVPVPVRVPVRKPTYTPIPIPVGMLPTFFPPICIPCMQIDLPIVLPKPDGA